MKNADVFSIVNMMAMMMWALMIIAPKWKITKSLMDYKVVPILLSLVYASYISLNIAETGFPDFGSLDSVMKLFTDQDATLAGWVHYLAFDLLIGMWILSQNEKHNLPIYMIIPCLLLTFMLGPVGFLLFIIISSLKSK